MVISKYFQVEVPSEVQEPDKDGGQVCRHDYWLDEEIGIFCRICGFVSTEIKDVTPPFVSQIRGSKKKPQVLE